MKRENDPFDINKIDLPRIQLSKEEFQNILDVEGYDMTVDELIELRKEDEHSI